MNAVQSLNKKTISYIKSVGIDMINKAESGHPGIVLGAAPILYTLYKEHLNYNPKNPNWINRDRFIMSVGHGSALLYSTLYMFGYNIPLYDLENFRKLSSKTPGHPELGVTPGVEVSTGPLGQGFANAVGMAIGAKILNGKHSDIFDYRVYTLCGDGDLMEGISTEAASLAGTLELSNLIVLYDSNQISLDGKTSKTFTENIQEKFRAMGWATFYVKNGDSVEEISRAITKAKKESKPSLIEISTVIGEGSMLEGKCEVHGKPLTQNDIRQLKETLNIEEVPFEVPDEIMEMLSEEVDDRVLGSFNEWKDLYDIKKGEVNYLYKNNLNALKFLNKVEIKDEDSLRVINGKFMNEISRNVDNFIGGSADLSSSTKTYLKNEDDILVDSYKGKNIWYGVREHSMAAISNGLALTGFLPFASTFLVFSDYMKPSIRLTSMMNLPAYYIFTHDSINIGEDGPTHQPIEQLSMLRSIPNMTVFRPADKNEIIGAWDMMLKRPKPYSLVLSRESSLKVAGTSASMVSKGAYIVKREKSKIDGLIIATGTEVGTAVSIANNLYNNSSLDIRVISMPSIELFLKQKKEYRDEIIPKDANVIVIEMASSFGWHRFVKEDKNLITIDEFGSSGSKLEVLDKYDFTYEDIKDKVERLLK